MTSLAKLGVIGPLKKKLLWGLSLSCFLGVTSAAQAHRVFTQYDGFGGIVSRGAYHLGLYPGVNRQTQLYFDSAFPSGSYKEAVIRGSHPWNDLNRTLTFTAHRTPEVNTSRTFSNYCRTLDGSQYRDPPTRQGRPVSLMFWEAIDGVANKLATVNWCFRYLESEGAYRPFAFKMRFDRSEPWYRGTSRSVPSDKFDLQSVATHEFGHATGWYPHYDPTEDTPGLPGKDGCGRNDSQRWTMCARISGRGRSRERTLQRHDKHTFRAAYPVR